MEEGGEKKFDTIEIVFLVMIALFNDAVTICSDLGLAIPILGEVLFGFSWLLDGFVWALIMFWYIMKLGVFGAPALTQVVAGVVDFTGIPSRTIGVVIGIFLANHPKAMAVAAVATGKFASAEKAVAGEVAAGEKAVEAGGAAKGAAGATEAGGAVKGVGAAEAGAEASTVAKAGEGAAEMPKGKPSEELGGKPSEVHEEGKPSEKPKSEGASDEALGEEPTPFEKLEKLLEKTPESDKKPDEDEDDEELPKAA